MRRRLLFFVLLTAIALAAVFLAGYQSGDHQKLAADLLAAVNFQNNASSSANATTSPESDAGATSTPTLADVLQELQDNERLLTHQVADLRSQLAVANLKAVFTRVMQRGDSGEDVSKLQELLGKVPGAYPPEVDASDTITGFYGSLTKAAVMAFQAQEELKPTGVVDPDTRKKLYELAANLIVDENTSTEFIDLSTVADQISQPSNAQASTSDLSDQISQLASEVSSTQASIADLQNQISQINSDIANLQGNIAAIQNSPPPPSPTPSPTPAPAPAPAPTPTPSLAISNMKVINITQTSSTIAWTTNNPSTSEVDYSTNASIPANQVLTVSSSVMVANHNVVLLRLNTVTTYYYRVISKDNTGTVASSAIVSFTTSH